MANANTADAAEGVELGAWQAAPPLPIGVGGHVAWWQGGQIWSAGGTFWEGGEKSWMRSIWSWKPGAAAAQRWQYAGNLPHPWAYMVLVPRGQGSPAAVGGVTGEVMPVEAVTLGPGDASERPAPLPALPEPVAYAAGGRVGGAFYLVGGAADWQDFGSAHDHVLRLPLGEGAGEWARIDPVPGGPRALAAVAPGNDQLYVFGGARTDEAGNVINLASAYAYSPETQQWRKLRDLPRAGRGITAAALDDRHVLLIGGYLDAGQGEPAGFSAQALIYDTQHDTYRATTPMPYAAGTVAVVVHEGRVYAIGGEDWPRSRTAHVVYADVQRAAPSLPALAD